MEQINRNIELIRYRKFGNDLIMFELVNVTSGQEIETENKINRTKGKIFLLIIKNIRRKYGKINGLTFTRIWIKMEKKDHERYF